MLRLLARVLLPVLAIGGVAVAHAQASRDFYAGKTLTIAVGSSVGGYYDIGARTVARHLAHYIPGNPQVIVQNQPGGGGLSLANRMANGMERDGLTIVAMNRALPQLALVDDPNANFDPMKLTWLGSLTSYADDGYLLIVNSTNRVKTFAEALSLEKPLHLGGTTAGATNIVFGLLARDLLGMKVDLVRGFPGAAEIWLAMERGELDGQVVDLSAILVGRPDGWKNGAFRPLVVFGRKQRMAEAPDVPVAREVVKNPDDLALLEFAEQPFEMALPFAAPPGVPADRARVLADSFMAMARDPAFRADIRTAGILTSPVDADAVRASIERAAHAPLTVRQRFARLLAM